MSTPNAYEFEVFDCSALDAQVRFGFRALDDNGVETDYCGLRGVYRADNRAWDEDGDGKWQSGMAPQTIPTGLALDGSTPLARDAATQRDTVYRVASGASLTARWQYLYTDKTGFPCRAKVWDCATGALAFSGLSSTNAAALGVLPDGAYTLAVALEGAAQTHLSQGQYAALTGQAVAAEYFYEESGATYFYDYRKNLGVRPSEPAHELNMARREIELSGAQEDKPEWIQYATAHEAYDSQWAMLPFVVGAGDFVVGDGVLPAPDCALIAAPTSTETVVVTPATLADVQLPFDPFARSVAHYYKASDGAEYITGERSCANGTETALWRWIGDGTAELLGTSPNYSTGLCECAGLQSAHEGRRIVETQSGAIIVQTLCSVFRYDPHGASIETRLVPYPRATSGHPGGRSLTSPNGGKTLYYSTEFFGERKDGEPAAQFYSTVVTRGGELQSESGIGTAGHYDGDLAAWKSRVYGVVCNKLDFAADGALMNVAQISGAGWAKTAMRDYDAATTQLQRVARVGWHLVATGKARTSEAPLLLVNDGHLIEWAHCNYRTRQMDAVMNESGFETGLAPALTTADIAAGFLAPRRLVELGQRATGRIHDGEPLPVADVPATNAQEQLDEFGVGAVWFGEPLFVWSGEVAGIAIIDTARWSSPSAPRDFSAYFKAMLAAGKALVWARIDSNEAANVLASYALAVPRLNDLWMLPVAAKTKIEIVVVLPNDAEKMEPLRLQELC